MGAAAKMRAPKHDFRQNGSRRDIPPADYEDEVTDEQISAVREIVEKTIKDDEWVIVDGPAW